MSDFNGRFSLFPTKEKKSEKSPDYSGTIELPVAEAMAMAEWITAQPGEDDYNGKPVIKIRLAGWKTKSKGGLNYLSGRVQPSTPQQQQANSWDNDDEVPF